MGGGENPAVGKKTRQVPVLLGGMVEASFERAARLADGYIAGGAPAPMIAPAFDAVRTKWKDAGRTGSPRLVAAVYYAFDDIDAGRANVRDYYSIAGEDIADFLVSTVSHGADEVKATINAFEEIGADELIFTPTVSDPSEIDRLAEVAL